MFFLLFLGFGVLVFSWAIGFYANNVILTLVTCNVVGYSCGVAYDNCFNKA